MKITKILALILLLLFSALICTACNAGTNLPSEGTVAVTDTSALEDTSAVENTTASSEDSSLYYNTESDDLEIMTVPDSDGSNSSSHSGSASSENEDSHSAAQDKSEETQAPASDEQEETKIELPFIPAN